MSISKRKLAANRANAQKSTGPKTPEGRAIVASNRVQHGLCGRFSVLPNENQDEYNDLVQRFLDAEQPADHVERELVAKMARHTWLSERCIRFQEACFLFQPQTDEQKEREKQSVAVMKDIDVYLRYQAHHDRAYQRAANELAKRRKDRMLAARGFESQKRAAAAEERSAKRQQQRDELHPWRVATAELQFDRLQGQCSKAKAAGQALDSGQIAA